MKANHNSEDLVLYEKVGDSKLLICKFKQSGHIDLNAAKKIVSDRINATNNSECLCLIYSPKSMTVSNDAISFVLSKKSRAGVIAMAIIDKNKIKFTQRLLNLFFKLFIRDSRLKIFEYENAALLWLLKFNKS